MNSLRLSRSLSRNGRNNAPSNTPLGLAGMFAEEDGDFQRHESNMRCAHWICQPRKRLVAYASLAREDLSWIRLLIQWTPKPKNACRTAWIVIGFAWKPFPTAWKKARCAR